MSRKVMKILSVMLLIAMIVGSVSCVFAAPAGLLNEKIEGTSSELTKKTETAAGKILGVVQIIGVAVATIMLIVLAIKYISSAPNDKAQIKQHAVVYVVGALVLFGSAGIIELLKNFSDLF